MDTRALENVLSRNGETITLRRLTGRGFWIDVQCRARVNDYSPDEMQGGIEQGDQKVVLSNAEITAAQWPGPPRIGDVILRNGGTLTAVVRAVSSNTLDNIVVRHNLTVRGT